MKMKSSPDISDLFLYGRLNYYAATDSAYQDKQPTYLAEADTILHRWLLKFLITIWEILACPC